MKKRNRALRIAEIVLIAGFILALFLVEQKVVTVWFSTSMKNALQKVSSTLQAGSDNGTNDYNQQLRSEEQLMQLALYYLQNNTAKTTDEDVLSELCAVYDEGVGQRHTPTSRDGYRIILFIPQEQNLIASFLH